MGKSLQSVFPMYKNREEVLKEIQNKEDLKKIYEEWEEEERQRFLDICSGARGMRVLCDPVFKEIMNPEIAPERLEELLSLLLETEIKVLHVLPNESSRISVENSLLIMDIVVKLLDGGIANIEVQRIGYAFPGERGACYSADLLMRQYKRVRLERGKKFKYRDIKKVYTIVFLEHSSSEFHALPQKYIHHGKQQFDTGLKLDMLQEFCFVALDNFHKLYQNGDRSKKNKLEAWLTFLSNDSPDEILRLIDEYPEFKEMYEKICAMCKDVGEYMKLFSEELAILDKNTVDYMVDEMQKTIDEQKAQLQEQTAQLEEQKTRIAELESKLKSLELN